MDFGSVFSSPRPFPWEETFAATRDAQSPAEIEPGLYNRFGQSFYAELSSQTRIPVSQTECDLLRMQMAPVVDPLHSKFLDPLGVSILAELFAHENVKEDAGRRFHACAEYVHLAGSLPGFSEYMMARVGFYCRGSLIPANDRFAFAGPHAWSATGLYFPTHSRLLTGPCGISDIRKLTCRVSLLSSLNRRHPNGVGFFLADVNEPETSSVSPDSFAHTGECGETQHLPWFASELWLLCQVLREGGLAVLKINHFFLPSTVELLWLVTSLFARVVVARSRHCILGSADCYLVAWDFKRPKAACLAWLLAFFEKRIYSLTTPTTAASAFEPFLDLAITNQMDHFVRFEKDFILPRSKALSKYRTKCLKYLGEQQGDALAKCMLRFHGEPPLFSSSDSFVFAQPSVFAAGLGSVQVAAFMNLVQLEQPDNLLIAALIPREGDNDNKDNDRDEEKQEGEVRKQAKTQQKKRREFEFYRHRQVCQLESTQDGIWNTQLECLFEDLEQVLSPGMLVEVRPDSKDFVKLCLQRIVVSVPAASVLKKEQILSYQRILSLLQMY